MPPPLTVYWTLWVLRHTGNTGSECMVWTVELWTTGRSDSVQSSDFPVGPEKAQFIWEKFVGEKWQNFGYVTTIFPDETFLQQISYLMNIFTRRNIIKWSKFLEVTKFPFSSWALIWEGIKMLGLLIIFHLKRDAKKNIYYTTL